MLTSKLTAGGTSIGTFIFEFNTTGIGRIVAEAGADFAVFDMEHTGWSIETIRMLVATTRSTNLILYVHIPATEYHFFARALDIGAMGIMVPMVESAEQAEMIVASAKYPPMGRPGAAFGIAHDDYGGLGARISRRLRSVVVATGHAVWLWQSQRAVVRRGWRWLVLGHPRPVLQ